jgi:hypothetical protein
VVLPRSNKNPLRRGSIQKSTPVVVPVTTGLSFIVSFCSAHSYALRVCIASADFQLTGLIGLCYRRAQSLCALDFFVVDRSVIQSARRHLLAYWTFDSVSAHNDFSVLRTCIIMVEEKTHSRWLLRMSWALSSNSSIVISAHNGFCALCYCHHVSIGGEGARLAFTLTPAVTTGNSNHCNGLMLFGRRCRKSSGDNQIPTSQIVGLVCTSSWRAVGFNEPTPVIQDLHSSTGEISMCLL